jgi:hypothetical protein
MSKCDHTYFKVTKSVFPSTTMLPPGTEITCQDCGERRLKTCDEKLNESDKASLGTWVTLHE